MRCKCDKGNKFKEVNNVYSEVVMKKRKKLRFVENLGDVATISVKNRRIC